MLPVTFAARFYAHLGGHSIGWPQLDWGRVTLPIHLVPGSLTGAPRTVTRRQFRERFADRG